MELVSETLMMETSILYGEACKILMVRY